MKKNFERLMLVTHKGTLPTQAYLEFIALCVKSGVTCVQLREKLLDYEALLNFGQSLKKLLDSNNIPLIVNDNVDLCLQLDAAGVHLGQTDGDPIQAREKIGANKIIGLSVSSIAQIEIANRLPLDYIGLGAIFPTKNKADVQTIWGLEGLKKAFKCSHHPMVAIGGIDESNAASVIQSGAKGIAGIGVFHDAVDPYKTIQNLIKITHKVYHAE